MFKVVNFCAGQADSILVHMEDKNGKYFNLLVDGAYAKTKIQTRLGWLEEKEQDIQGIVVTHVDNDHISGISDLVRNKESKIKNAFLLFNNYDENLVSYAQAKRMMADFRSNFRDNIQICSYDEEYPVSILEKLNREPGHLELELLSLAQRRKCPKIDENKVVITILGPGREDVEKLMRDWHSCEENKKQGNSKVINASSIVLLIEYEGKTVLLSGDGYFTDIKNALKVIEDVKQIDLIKASHHGAKENNKGLADIVREYNCRKVFFTISQVEFLKKNEHPDPELLETLKFIQTKDGHGVKAVCSCNITDPYLTKYMSREEAMEV
jgi:ribonuclease BN (tRNA processing enzyme)